MNFKTILFVLIISISNIFSQSVQIFSHIGNFITLSGDTIKDCRVGYRTFGKLNDEKSNAIIYCSSFGGTSESIGSLIEKRNFVDTLNYFVIAFDALGNGVSSSPSNYHNNSFPEITITDMVNSQYITLTKNLGIERLYGAIGGSMGSMQVLEWAATYPLFIDKIAAYVSSPKLTSYDLLWMNTQLKMMEILRKYGASEREIKTLSNMMTAWISRSPEHINENVKLEEFQNYFAKFENDPSETFTNDNYISQMKAMINHDISRKYNYSLEETAVSIKSELFFIVAKNDMMVSPETSIKLAELTKARLTILENDCGHLAVSCEFDKVKEEIDDFLNN
ncbi:MAG: alpha/beta fold hydrolase [Ignavibacterium sp.]|nr:alpha/beta fold hydrolase [Ignavibacterium sp.]